MNWFKRLLHWRDLTLPGQFLLAGAVVMSLAMAIVGNWIGSRIEDALCKTRRLRPPCLWKASFHP